MRNFARLVVLCVSFTGTSLCAENSVVVESKTVPAGQKNVKIGVFLVNERILTGLELPFEFREITPGSYLASKPWITQNPSGRFCHSGLGSCPSPDWPPGSSWTRYFAVRAATWQCGGPISGTYDVSSATFDFTSPDGLGFGTVSLGCPDCGLYPLDPGADPPGTQNASFTILFDVTTTPGQFEIDTCCVRPAVHLSFVDGGTQSFVPDFTKSVITIIPCFCPCAADPVCDSTHDISDVTTLINVAFRGIPDIADSTCTVSRTDVNADGQTDVADVVKMIFVAFLGQPAEMYFANPCP